MIITVDTTVEPSAVLLDEADDCSRFHVAITGKADEATIQDALVRDGVGVIIDRDTAVITVEAVRRMAQGRVDSEWSERFTEMLEYAGAKGWLDDDRTGIRAHCEWP